MEDNERNLIEYKLDRRAMLASVVTGAAFALSAGTLEAQTPNSPVNRESFSDPLGRIPLEKHTYTEISAKGIGERNTVSNGPDSGANNCMAPHFWQAKRHGTTQQAADNGLIPVVITIEPPVLDITSAGGMNLGGHGNEGLIETGMGQTGPFNTNQVILTWNESIWGPQLV